MRSRYEKVKPRVTFVHGAGGGAWEWGIWRRVFAAHGWEVRAPNLLPVHGRLIQTHLQDYVRQLEDEMRGAKRDAASSECRRDVLLGASLGGLLALIVAQKVAPAALVLINPLPPANIAPQSTRRDWPDIVPWGSTRSFASTCRAMPDADDAARWFAFRRWRDESGAVLREAYDTQVNAPSCPTLVIASEADDDVSMETSRALANAYNAEFRLLRDANHLTPLLGRTANGVAFDTVDWCNRHSQI